MALLSSILQQQKPPEWDEHNYTNKRFVRITLEESSQEYEQIKATFIQKYGDRKITKIERVQHPFAFARFKIRGEQLAKKNGNMPEEIRQFFIIDNPNMIETILEFNCDHRRGGCSYSSYNLFGSRYSRLSSGTGLVIAVKTFSALGFDERDTHRYPEYLIECESDKTDPSTESINKHLADKTLPLLKLNLTTRMEEVSVVPPESDTKDKIASGRASIPVLESSALNHNSGYRMTTSDVEVISIDVSSTKRLRMSPGSKFLDELLLVTNSAIAPSSESVSTNCASILFEKSTNNSNPKNLAGSDDTPTSPMYSPSSPSYNPTPSCDTPFSSCHSFTSTSSGLVSPEYSQTSLSYSLSPVSLTYSPSSPSSSPVSSVTSRAGYNFTSPTYSNFSPSYSTRYPVSAKGDSLSDDNISVSPIKNETLSNNDESSPSYKGSSSIASNLSTSPVYILTSPSSSGRSPSYNTSFSSIHSLLTCPSYSPTSPSSVYNSPSPVCSQTLTSSNTTLLNLKLSTSDGNKALDNNCVSPISTSMCLNARQPLLERSPNSLPYSPSCSLNVLFSPDNVSLPSERSTSPLDSSSSPIYNSTSVINNDSHNRFTTLSYSPTSPSENSLILGNSLPWSVSDLRASVSLQNTPPKCEQTSPNKFSPSSTCWISSDSKVVSPHDSCSSLVLKPNTPCLGITSLPYGFTSTNNLPSNYDSISPTYSPTSPSSCISSLQNNSIVCCDLTSPYSVTSPIGDIPSPDCKAISPAYNSVKTPSSPIFKLTAFNYHSTFLKKD